MQLKEAEKKIILVLLKTYLPDCEIWLFGSRAKNTAGSFSDCDLMLKCADKIDLLNISQIEEAFAESDLTFKVDIVDWHRIKNDFQQHIMQHALRLSP